MCNCMGSTNYFCATLKETERKRNILEDEKKLHGTVDESLSEQQFHKSDAITFVVWKIWSHTPTASGSYGRQSG